MVLNAIIGLTVVYQYLSDSLKIRINTNWLLLLLIFVGQTIAAPLADINDCEIEHSTSVKSDLSMSVHDMDSMSDHDMSMMEMYSDAPMDCCADDCQCSDSMFASTLYYSFNKSNAIILTQHKVEFQVSQFLYTQFSSSIYRPPIFS